MINKSWLYGVTNAGILSLFILSACLPAIADEIVNVDLTLHSSDNVVGGTTESVFSFALGSTLINGQVGIKECDTSGDDSWCANNLKAPMPTSQPTWKYKKNCSGLYCVSIATAVSTPTGLLYTPYKSTYALEGYTAQPDGSYIIPSRDYRVSLKLLDVLPVGVHTFPSVRIDKLIICKSTPNYGQSSCSANTGSIFIQYLSADVKITVPQSCTVNSGQTVNVELNEASSAAFVKGGAGNTPSGVGEKTVSVPIQCLGGGAGTVTMSLHGTNATNYASSLATSNSDVGVKVVDRTAGSGNSGQPLIPNNASSFSMIQLGQDGSGMATLGISPIWLGANSPAKGNYTAQSYLQLDYQ